ncbi:MAG: imidazoleglycerol-phosphate dehydratase [Candidatus Nitrosopolaris sp.]
MIALIAYASAIQRTSKIKRITKETSVTVEVNIDGTGKTAVETGLSLIDHLIVAIGKHSMIDITLTAISIDGILHHLVEDVSIALSQSIDTALAGRSRIMRYGHAVVPMDESLAYVAIDLIKRQFYNMQLNLTEGAIEGIPCEDLEHFVRSLIQNLNACTHIVVQYGNNDHHKIESALKAFAVAFRMAANIDRRRGDGVPSTKGAM